jgi:CRP-like cAMP-binding protein
MNASALTPPQRRVLMFLLERENARQIPPTYREIAAVLGWRAAGTVRDHVHQLSRKGYLARSRKARSLRLTDSGREAAGRTESMSLSAPGPSTSLSSETEEFFTMLAPYFRARRYPPGTVLWRAGEPASAVVAIDSGHVRIYRILPNGNAAALYLFGPGEFFGFLPLLDGRPYPATAEAVDDVLARTMSREGFLRGLRENPLMVSQLFSFLGRRLREAFERIELLSAHGAIPRVAASLAAMLHDRDGGTTTIVSLPVSSREFARALGITPESFSRAITGLVEAGTIHRLGRGRFQILDPQSLRAAASPGIV